MLKHPRHSLSFGMAILLPRVHHAGHEKIVSVIKVTQIRFLIQMALIGVWTV